MLALGLARALLAARCLGGYAGYNRAALALLGLSGAEPRKNKSPGSEGKPGLLSVVAGRGFEPLTFRL